MCLNCALELEINVRELFSMKSHSFVTLFLDFENWKLFGQEVRLIVIEDVINPMGADSYNYSCFAHLTLLINSLE